ncbi:MAG: hypothetical protein KGI59_03315 [Patescibacteria group bacterium]|nr:hypothetical protein [Patescibacteria group bacterium]MDE2172361.1 hypothetical protein [Patescibacteria group bacterium]
MTIVSEKALWFKPDLTAASDPTERLCLNVMRQIAHRETVRASERALAFSLGALGGIVACGLLIAYIATSLIESGFTTYVSLALSDGSLLAAHGQDLLSSIIDSVPFTLLTAICAAALISLVCVKYISRTLSVAAAWKRTASPHIS